jgi:hypothetical protein
MLAILIDGGTLAAFEFNECDPVFRRFSNSD